MRPLRPAASRWTRPACCCPASRIAVDQARLLLPGPPPASLAQVAGLLEGPEASPQDDITSQRLRDLAQMLRDRRAESDRRWTEQRQREHTARAEQKHHVIAAIEAELARRGLFPGGTLEVAA